MRDDDLASLRLCERDFARGREGEWVILKLRITIYDLNEELWMGEGVMKWWSDGANYELRITIWAIGRLSDEATGEKGEWENRWLGDGEIRRLGDWMSCVFARGRKNEFLWSTNYANYTNLNHKRWEVYFRMRDDDLASLRLCERETLREGEWAKGRMGDSEITNYKLRITIWARSLEQRLSDFLSELVVSRRQKAEGSKQKAVSSLIRISF